MQTSPIISSLAPEMGLVQHERVLRRNHLQRMFDHPLFWITSAYCVGACSAKGS